MIHTLTVECVSGAYLKEQCIRVIEIDENATLYELHYAIQDAVGFGKDHPYEFYIGRNYRNRKCWITNKEDWEEKENDFCEIELHDIYPLNNMKLYYWFDFGDSWIFEIRKSRKIKEPEPGIQYPRIVESIGPNPEQYPRFDG